MHCRLVQVSCRVLPSANQASWPSCCPLLCSNPKSPTSKSMALRRRSACFFCCPWASLIESLANVHISSIRLTNFRASSLLIRSFTVCGSLHSLVPINRQAGFVSTFDEEGRGFDERGSGATEEAGRPSSTCHWFRLCLGYWGRKEKKGERKKSEAYTSEAGFLPQDNNEVLQLHRELAPITDTFYLTQDLCFIDHE